MHWLALLAMRGDVPPAWHRYWKFLEETDGEGVGLTRDDVPPPSGHRPTLRSAW